MESQTFTEVLKNKTLYEMRGIGGLPVEILNIGRGNVSPKLARYYRMGVDMCSTMPEELSLKILPIFQGIRAIYPEMEGWAVKQAIQAEGERQLKEDATKKQGLLSWLT